MKITTTLLPSVFAASLLLPLCATSTAMAEKITYFSDPVFQRTSTEEPHPMDDIIALAEGGDVRAQYILADLYAKGKGGLVKTEKTARIWFQRSAQNGYAPSFFRLAAIAKRGKKPVEAYQWYTLAIETFRSGPDQQYAIRARNALAEDAKLTPDQIKEARKDAADWKDARIKENREKQEAQRKAEQEKKRQEREDKKSEDKEQARTSADKKNGKETSKTKADVETANTSSPRQQGFNP